MSDIDSAIHTLRNEGGFFEAKHFGLIEVYGRDATKFLQAQTTNDVSLLSECCHQTSCLLDRKAHIQGCFDLYRRHESYRIIVESEQVIDILNHLDRHRVADKVEFLDLTETGQFFVLQGPRCRRVMRAGLHSGFNPAIFKNDVVDLKLWDKAVHVFRKSVTGEDGYFLWVSKSDCQLFRKNFTAVANELGLVALDAETIDTARIESGLLKFGVDFSKENFLPETGLDQSAVSYTKGCFLGQEVLARVKNQGAPTRGMIGLTLPPEAKPLKHGDKLLANGEEIATVSSAVFSPTLKANIAIASVKRDYRTPDKSLTVTVGGEPLKPLVSLLPFYQSPPLQVKARSLYEKSLKLYADENDTDAQSLAVDLLREVIELDPVFEDGYEALGVILSKRGHLDEAIELMKMLVNLNPESVMAHTNLSVFYVDKGLKDLAEEEKAISVSIRMRQAASQVTNKKEDENKKAQELEETKQRMDMFRQVIEIDENDLLANYGMGSCHVALGQFQKAIPYLTKAIEIKPTHTVAFNSLAQAYEATGETELAQQTYEKGIEVAAKRGDMTPLADMQRRLSQLKAGTRTGVV